MENKIMEAFCEKIPGFKEYYHLEKQNLERYNAGNMSDEEYSEATRKICAEYNERINNLTKK